MCDGTVAGKSLPQNLRIVAACNPYRLRRGVHDGASNEGVEPSAVGLASGIQVQVQYMKLILTFQTSLDLFMAHDIPVGFGMARGNLPPKCGLINLPSQ